MRRTVRAVFSARNPHPSRKHKIGTHERAVQALKHPKTAVSTPDTVKFGFSTFAEAAN